MVRKETPMNLSEEYYTLKGYSLLEGTKITTAMEDYLETLYRLEQKNNQLRISQVAEFLHVRPSSASKMISNLKSAQLVNFEKYGLVTLTSPGRELGAYLLYRHNILHSFFCFINQTENELEQVEKVEHFIDRRTVVHIAELLKKLESPEASK